MPTRSPLPAPLAALTVLAMLPLAPLPAAAQGTSEQRAACTGDAMRLCLSAVPDVGRITACMKSHYGELSPRCQATFNEAKPAAPPHKLAEEPAKPQPAAPAVKQAEAPVAPRQTARVAPLAPTPRGAAAAHQRVVRAPVERAPVEQHAATHRRDAEPGRRELAARELPSRGAPLRERPARELPSREPAEAAVVPAPADDLDRAPPYPAIAGGAIPAPRLVTGLSASTGNLALACREGLIDPFTCGNTIPALGLRE